MKLGGNGEKGWKQKVEGFHIFPLLYFWYLLFATKDSNSVMRPVLREREERVRNRQISSKKLNGETNTEKICLFVQDSLATGCF